MADTNFQSYHVVGNREDLLGLIQQISRTEAPVSSRLATGPKATNRLHEWQTDALATPSVNAAIEGANFSQGTLTPTTRLGNWTQILRKDIKVSGSQADAFNHAGADNEYSYQKAKAMKEIVRDEEFSLIHATGNSGDSGTARVMKGIMQQITTNVDTGTATNNSTVLTEARFNNMLQTVYSAGAGQPDLVVVDPFNKRQITAFAGPTGTQRVNQADEKKLVNSVTTYTSDFGEEAIIPHYLLGAAAPAGAQTKSGTVLMLQRSTWRKAFARPMFEKDLGQVGDSYITSLIEELTLEGLAEQFNAKFTGYTTS